MKDSLADYTAASQLFLGKLKTDENVLGVVIAGSLMYNEIDKNSDIDIFVILHHSCQYRERGNTWINGVEIEYFKNPPQQIRSYFAKEVSSPHTAHMLANGEVVLCRSQVVLELIKEAKQIINSRPAKLNTIQIELEKYFIDDLFKDYEDSVYNQDEVGATIVKHKLINRCIDVFCKIHQLRREKDKRLKRQVSTVDSKYWRCLQEAIADNWDDNIHLTELKMATEKLLGGKRSEEWHLRSELDLS